MSRVAVRPPLLAVMALSSLLSACGAVAPAPPAPVVVTVTPASAQPFPGTGVQFRASVQNAAGSAVVWQVNQTAGGNSTVGTIDSNGYYTAPNTVPSPATVTVTAVLRGGSNASGSAQVTIQSLSAIHGPLTLSPQLASVTLTQPLQLQVTTPGVKSTDVAWQVDGFSGGNASVGTISAAGAYTPPPNAGPHTVIAVLNANTAAIGSAQVEVTDFTGNLTWRNDNMRSGINSRELVLSPSTVSPATFGKLFSCPIDGYAYAQPLYVPNLPIPGKGTHNVVFIATEKDLVYAFDADHADPSDPSHCQQLWSSPANLAPAGLQPVTFPNPQIKMPEIVPYVGITGTPVIDLNASALYAVAAVQDAATGTVFTHLLYALDLATGQSLVFPDGKVVSASLGQGLPFSSNVENQAAALLLDHGVIQVPFGSYGEAGDSRGWLLSYDPALFQPVGVFDVAPIATSGGGIEQSGGGPSADSNGNIFVATGDGPPNIGKNYIDSVIRLSTTGGLSVGDFFSPCDQGLDWGANPNAVLQSESSAPLVLPDSAGSSSWPHLLIEGSKEGILYVINRDSMGGFQSAPCPDSPSRVQTITASGPILSTPIFWNGFLYVAPGGNSDLQQIPMSNGSLSTLPPSSQSSDLPGLGPQGATPAISANEAGNAVLWLIDASGASTNGPAILRAYDPNNLSNEIYNSAAAGSRDQAGPAVNFTVPTVANGKVYVGTQTELDVYGLLN